MLEPAPTHCQLSHISHWSCARPGHWNRGTLSVCVVSRCSVNCPHCLVQYTALFCHCDIYIMCKRTFRQCGKIQRFPRSLLQDRLCYISLLSIYLFTFTFRNSVDRIIYFDSPSYKQIDNPCSAHAPHCSLDTCEHGHMDRAWVTEIFNGYLVHHCISNRQDQENIFFHDKFVK